MISLRHFAALTLVAGCAAAPAGTTPRIPSTAPAVATWAPWPSALHDARHGGSSTGDGPREGVVRWRRSLEGAVTPGPVVGADGTVYASSNGGVLHALDPVTGADRWTYDSGATGGGDLSVSPLVLPGGVVLFPTPGHEVVALSPDGARLWSVRLDGSPTSPVTVDGTRVYVGDTTGTVAALDPVSGGPLWTVDAGGVSYASVVTDGSGRVYTTVDSELVAVDDRGTDGVIAWRRGPGDGITEVSPGLAADGTVLLGTNGDHEWAYHPDGSLAWKAPRFITYSSPSVTADGLAYLGDHAGRILVFDSATGERRAVYGPAGGLVWTSVVVDRAHRVYFGGQDGHVYGYEALGARLFDVEVGGPVDSYPALTADGVLLVGSRDGVLTAIA
ncbi:PQQ-binding-like beta-propeller repeat protein [Umezawaea sp. NPDC059074]|uniref:outer membrane protein assembly factor BamB family protein n=1 Tax=Umezawaea sp. NPDC059074 TaxID=3346716 RepID=UPI0036B70BF3